jgi:hypothetical protein
MSNTFMEQYRQSEADSIAHSMQLNRWSRVMIEVMIQEQEEKLLASDQPVEGSEENGDFWQGLG